MLPFSLGISDRDVCSTYCSIYLHKPWSLDEMMIAVAEFLAFHLDGPQLGF